MSQADKYRRESTSIRMKAGDTFLGMPGAVWCIVAGLCFGGQNVFAKLAFDRGLPVTRFILMRSLVLWMASFLFGKIFRKTSFNLKKYRKKMIGVIFFRSLMSLVSKTLQYSAIAYIPLSLSSCISFTTGPVIAALLAFFLINETLLCGEVIPIACGIVGTMMITMPQWFLFLGIDKAAIQARLQTDLQDNTYFYYGIAIALISSGLDVFSYFIVRGVGKKVPNAIIPYMTGMVTFVAVLIYCCIYEPLDFTYFFSDSHPSDPNKELSMDSTSEYTQAIQLALIGSVIGWMAVEFIVVGLQMSKSAIASYGEMSGIIIPLLFDSFYFHRTFLSIDFIGLLLIVLLQLYTANKAIKIAREKAEKIETEEEERERGMINKQ